MMWTVEFQGIWGGSGGGGGDLRWGQGNGGGDKQKKNIGWWLLAYGTCFVWGAKCSCPKIKRFCPNITYFFAQNWLFEIFLGGCSPLAPWPVRLCWGGGGSLDRLRHWVYTYYTRPRLTHPSNPTHRHRQRPVLYTSLHSGSGTGSTGIRPSSGALSAWWVLLSEYVMRLL